MAKLKEFLQIGQIRKSHGLDGLIKLSIKTEFNHVLDKVDHFFVEENGQKLPLFIEDYTIDGSDYIIKFEDIDNPQDATQLSAKALYMDKAVLSTLIDYKAEVKDLPFDYADLIGYFIKDVNIPKNMEVMDVFEFPQQIMASVTVDDKDIFLPLQDTLIQSIDHDARIIYTTYPEGIFDL